MENLAAGLLPEVDAIGGAITRSGERHEVAAPIIQELVNEITGRLKKTN
jgi:ketopantoate reductase